VTYANLIFRLHAVRRMAQRGISVADVRHALTTGETIADYPNDTPYSSRLVLGWNGGRPLHVVAADNAAGQETIIITAYEPDPRQWSPDFRRRAP
jgi:hypothetical protein